MFWKPDTVHIVFIFCQSREEEGSSKSQTGVSLNMLDCFVQRSMLSIFVVIIKDRLLLLWLLREIQIRSYRSNQCPCRWKLIIGDHLRRRLIEKDRELVPDFKLFNRLKLCERGALERRSFVESNEVAVAGSVQAWKLIEDDVEHRERVKFLIYPFHMLSDNYNLMLHTEEAISHNVQAVGLNYRPWFNDLLFLSEARVVWVEFAARYADGLFVMYHFVKLGDLDHFRLLLVFLLFGSKGAYVAIWN